MSATLTISIPESYWRPISEAPRDGTLMFVRDSDGNVDIAAWDRGEWKSELGMGIPSEVEFGDEFAPMYMATPPDKDGKCGRCGRYRGGP